MMILVQLSAGSHAERCGETTLTVKARASPYKRWGRGRGWLPSCLPQSFPDCRTPKKQRRDQPPLPPRPEAPRPTTPTSSPPLPRLGRNHSLASRSLPTSRLLHTGNASQHFGHPVVTSVAFFLPTISGRPAEGACARPSSASSWERVLRRALGMRARKEGSSCATLASDRGTFGRQNRWGFSVHVRVVEAVLFAVSLQ